MSILEFKRKYNSTLEREKKAETYMQTATEEQFNKWNIEFVKIIIKLSKMMKECKCITGEDITAEEVLEGFKL